MSAVDAAEIGASVRAVLAGRLARGGDGLAPEDGGTIDRALWTEAADLGWFALTEPEETGGLGAGLPELCALYEELGAALAPLPALPLMLAIDAIRSAENGKFQGQLLERLQRGRHIVALALPEGEACLSHRSDGRIGGQVPSVLNAAGADLFFLPIRDDDRFGMLVVEPGAGIVVDAPPLHDRTRGIGMVTVDADASAGSAILVLSPEAWDGLRRHALLAIAADCVGGAAAIFDRTIEYLKLRRQFGRAIGSFQAIKHRAASWKVLLEAATALSRAAARGDDHVHESAAAKFYAADVYAGIAGDAIQLHGGIGFTWDYVCHLYLKRAKLNQILFGGAAEHKDRIAELILANDGDEHG